MRLSLASAAFVVTVGRARPARRRTAAARRRRHRGASPARRLDVFDNLPRRSSAAPLAQQSRILAADGSLIATFYDENRIVVPLARRSPRMRQAHGRDRGQPLLRARRRRPQGSWRARASPTSSGGDTAGRLDAHPAVRQDTLSENALRSNDQGCRARRPRAPGSTTTAASCRRRKLRHGAREALTKDQILQGYLNIVYFGDQAYGVEAAARHYFGVHASAADPPPGRHARRARPAPRRDRPGALPRGRAGPPRHRPGPDAPAEAHHRPGRRPRRGPPPIQPR